MKGLSIIDKFKVVFDVTKSNKLVLISVLALVLLSILFIILNKNTSKKKRLIFIGIYLVILILFIIKYHSLIYTMWDNMIDNLFIVFYFPNISVYVAGVIVTNIIVFISMFSKNTRFINRIINSFIFVLINYISILVIVTINKNNLNVFDSVKLYQNSNVHSLIELSSNIFIIWIIYLVLYELFITYFNRGKVKTTVKEIVKVKTKTKTIFKHNRLAEFVKEVKTPIIVKRDKTNIFMKTLPNNIVIKKEKTEKDNSLINILSYPYVVKKERMLPSDISLFKVPVVVKRDRTIIKDNNTLPSGISLFKVPVVVKRDRTVIKDNNTLPSGINVLKTPVVVKRDRTNYIYNTNRNTSIYDVDLTLDVKDYKEVLRQLQEEKNKLSREEELRIEKENQEKLSQLMDLYKIV